MKKNRWIILTALFIVLCLPLTLTGCAGDVAAPSQPSSTAGSNGGTQNTVSNMQPSAGDATRNPNVGKVAPYLAKTLFKTLDSVVVTADVTAYGADPTGQKDSTDAFSTALIEVGMAGGGTVWVPAGNYLITKTLNVPSLVTLRGDWNDPDAKDFNGDHGAVIYAKPKTGESEKTGLITVAECAGVYGLTIYYPEQDIHDVKPYAPTFFMGGNTRLRTLRNITLINAYVGAYVEAINESTNFINFKGTCLDKGMEIHSAADVGVFDQVSFSPKYWANAGDGLQKADAGKIEDYLKKNKRSAFFLHDLEQQQFSQITVSGYEYGIFFSAEQTRFMASGPMYQVNISDCTYGIYAESGTYESNMGYAANQCPILTALDWRCGYIISNSSIEGSKYSIYNGCDTVTVNGAEKTAYIHLTDVTLKGATKGNVSYTQEGKSAQLADMKDYVTAKTTGTAFEAVAKDADEATIQAALDRVGKAGGGVVYLPAGNYEISSGLTVPQNTEIVGAAGLPQRIPNRGTVLWCRQNGTAKEQSQHSAKAMITLAGDNSGVSGLYFIYDKNILAINQDKAISFFPFALRGEGKNVWAVNCCISGATYGIDFTDCDNHLIQSLFSCCIYSNMELSGNNGMVRNCLSNGTVMFRLNGVLEVDEAANLFQNYFNKLGVHYSEYITVCGGTGEQLYNNFMYGGRHLIYNEAGNHVMGVNLCSDNLGSYVIEQVSGSMTVANAIVTSDRTFQNAAGSLSVYNPLRNGDPKYPDFISQK